MKSDSEPSGRVLVYSSDDDWSALLRMLGAKHVQRLFARLCLIGALTGGLTIGHSIQAQRAGAPAAMRIAVLGLPASDSLIRQAVSLVEHESVSLLGKPYIATQSQIAEIIKAGFPESPPDSLSITDLRQLGKILRVTYVIDISSRRVGSDFEVSGRLLSSSENTNSENPKSVVLQSVRRPVLSEAVKEFTTLLSKENLQTK